MNSLENATPGFVAPVNPFNAEPLYIIKSEKLYLHVDLLVAMTEYLSAESKPKICGEILNFDWGKPSILHKQYRCRILPSMNKDYNLAIENAKWLCGIFLGELRKSLKQFVTMVVVDDKDCEILRNDKKPGEIIIKIAHQSMLPKINTYEAINYNQMKYRLNRDGYRVCYECEQEKELNADNFYADNTKGKGFQHICIKCVQKKRAENYRAKIAK